MARSRFLVKDTPLVEGLPLDWIHRVEVDYREPDAKGKGAMIITSQYAHNPAKVRGALDFWAGALARAVQRKVTEEIRERMAAERQAPPNFTP